MNNDFFGSVLSLKCCIEIMRSVFVLKFNKFMFVTVVNFKLVEVVEPIKRIFSVDMILSTFNRSSVNFVEKRCAIKLTSWKWSSPTAQTCIAIPARSWCVCRSLVSHKNGFNPLSCRLFHRVHRNYSYSSKLTFRYTEPLFIGNDICFDKAKCNKLRIITDTTA